MTTLSRSHDVGIERHDRSCAIFGREHDPSRWPERDRFGRLVRRALSIWSGQRESGIDKFLILLGILVAEEGFEPPTQGL